MFFFRLFLLISILFLNVQNLLALDPKDLTSSMISINSNLAAKINFDLDKVKDVNRGEISITPFLISPLLGAKLWESDVIWNYYKFLPKDDPVNKLTKEFFYENQGCFLETGLFRNLAHHLDVFDIGTLIGIYLKRDISPKKVKSLLGSKIESAIRKSNKIEDKIIKILKNIGIKYPDKEKIFKSPGNINLTKSQRKKFKNQSESKEKFEGFKKRFIKKYINENKLDEFIELLIKLSDEESNFYPKFTPIFVFQSLAYIKMNSKDDLIKYFEGVAQGLGCEISEIIDVDQLKEIRDLNYQEILKNSNGNSFKDISFDVLGIENFLISQILSGYLTGLPTITTYKSNVVFKNKTYPDCMETTVRNLINIILFKNSEFDFNLLSDEFKEFYSSDPVCTPTNVGNKEIHDKWSSFVNNKKFIPYLRLFSMNDGNEIHAFGRIDGFVIVPNFDDLYISEDSISDYSLKIGEQVFNLKKVEIKNEDNSSYRSYIVIDRSDKSLNDLYCYELLPSAETMVSILLRAFNQFTGKESTEDGFEFIRTDFFTKYFVNKLPDILENLNLNIVNSKLDLDKSFTLNLKKESNKFNVRINFKRHGEIPLGSIKEIVIKYNSELNLSEDNVFGYVALAGLNSKDLLLNDLSNISKRLSFIEKYFKENGELKEEELIINLINSLEFVQEVSFISTIRTIVLSIDMVDSFVVEQFFKKAIEIAIKAFKFNDSAIQIRALELFAVLVGKDKEFKEAAVAASEGIKSSNEWVRVSALKLFAVLVDNDYEAVYEEAAVAASEGIKSSNEWVRASALKLFAVLVDNDYEAVYEEATAAALEGIKNSDRNIQSSSLSLFEVLFEKGKSFEEAAADASEGIKSSKEYVQSSALQLFGKLFKRDKGFKEADAAASEGIESSDENVRISASELFEALFENDKGFKEAAAAASEGIKAHDKNIRVSALELFKMLFEKDKGFKEAFAAALEVIKSSDRYTRVSALKLFETLINHNYKDAYKAAVVAASREINDYHEKRINDGHEYVWIISLELFAILVEKNIGFKEAATAASEGIKDSDISVRSSALRLFKMLFAKDKGFKEAATATSEGIKAHNKNIRASALELFKMLFEKDMGLKEVAAAALEGIKSSKEYVKSSTLELFEMLVEKNIGLKEAAAAASEGIKNYDRNVQSSALRLFKMLFAKDKGLKEAAADASEGIKNYDRDVRSSALRLFKMLFAKDKGFKEATAAASEGIKNSDRNIQSSSLSLFEVLFEKGKSFEEAAADASEGINSSKEYVQSSALQLFGKLFKRNKGFKEADAAASEGIKSSDENVRISASKLFMKLINKNYEVDDEKAAAAASEGIKNFNRNVQYSALRMFMELFAKDKGFKEAAAAASEGIKDCSQDIQSSALRLFNMLFKKSKGFKEAAAAASKGINDRCKYVRISALKLFAMLVDNGYEDVYENAATAALEIISRFSKSNNIIFNRRMKQSLLELFQTLINKGVFLNIKDKSGKTALDYAKQKGLDEIETLLSD